MQDIESNKTLTNTCYVYFNVHGLPEPIIHSYYRKAVDYQTQLGD